MAPARPQQVRNEHRPVTRPEHPTDAERALWWVYTNPDEDDLRRWQRQLSYDLATKDGDFTHLVDFDDPDQLCHLFAMVLPDTAFCAERGETPVEALASEVPITWLFSGGDAWTVAFSSRLAGHGAPELAGTLRTSLRRNELPTLAEQTVCNRVFSELLLRQWVDIAICERWTVRRGAEIARNAGTFNPEICAWLNQHADPSRLARPDPLPVPETARETRDRCFAQPLVHR